MRAQHYLSGERVHAGDKVKFGGCPSTVLFVNDTEDYLPGFTAEDWAYLGPGFMLQQENGTLIYQKTVDEDLRFISRKANE